MDYYVSALKSNSILLEKECLKRQYIMYISALEIKEKNTEN